MASTPAPKPRQEVLPPTRAGRKLTPVERAIERSDIKVDLAACIRWFWFGLAAFVTALTGLVIAMHSVPDADEPKAEKAVAERVAVIGGKAAKGMIR